MKVGLCQKDDGVSFERYLGSDSAATVSSAADHYTLGEICTDIQESTNEDISGEADGAEA